MAVSDTASRFFGAWIRRIAQLVAHSDFAATSRPHVCRLVFRAHGRSDKEEREVLTGYERGRIWIHSDFMEIEKLCEKH